MITLDVCKMSWPLKVPFTIARETLFDIPCILVCLTDALGNVGRGEAVGVDYAGETPDTMMAQIIAVKPSIEAGITRAALHDILPAGGARNAVDCALWDLEAKQSGMPAWRRAGLDRLIAQPTAFSFGIMSEEELRATAKTYRDFKLLKVKTNKLFGLDPVRIVHEEAPGARLIVDPNESWGEEELLRFAPHLAELNVVLLEQPVHPTQDAFLRKMTLPVPVAADEAFNDRSNIPDLVGKYQCLNIKLDKTGGLTEALACVDAGRAAGFSIMIGCMVGSSLAMAPGTLIAQSSAFVDLDGPLLQAADCDHGLTYENGMVGVPSAALWG
jgi:L-Ala-D/L-Glu epimerase